MSLKINPFTDIDYGNLWNKFVGGDKNADVIRKYDNVKLNANTLSQGGTLSALQGQDAYAEGGSKYVADNGLSFDGPTNPIYSTPTPTVDVDAQTAAQQAAQQAAQKRAIMEASLAAIQQNIDSLGVRKNNTLAGVDQRYASILSKYADQEAQNQARFGKETEANEGTYSRNQSLALQSAATGRQGLMATLGSIGALGPTALNLANRAVARSANMDLGEAGRTFEGNAATLTEEFNKTRQDEENRKLEAQAAREADRQSAEYDYIEALQKAYSDMATTRATGGDADGASALTRQAGGLYSQLAAKTRPITAPYQARDISLDTSKLASYLAGQRQNTVTAENGLTAGPRAMNSPLYAAARRKEELV